MIFDERCRTSEEIETACLFMPTHAHIGCTLHEHTLRWCHINILNKKETIMFRTGKRTSIELMELIDRLTHCIVIKFFLSMNRSVFFWSSWSVNVISLNSCYLESGNLIG